MQNVLYFILFIYLHFNDDERVWVSGSCTLTMQLLDSKRTMKNFYCRTFITASIITIKQFRI